MSMPKDVVRLQHMRDYAKEAVEMIAGLEREDLYANHMLNLALVRLLEVIGEAAAKVTEETRSAHPELPWTQMT